MNAIDAYDIRQAVEALDEECQGSLNFAQLQTLYLGLGFSRPTSRMTVEQLQADARQSLGRNCDTLTVAEIIDLFRKMKYSRDRSHAVEATFVALNGDNKNGHLTAQDLVLAAQSVQCKLSPDLAQHMVALAAVVKSDTKGLTRQEFARFWAPPDPE